MITRVTCRETWADNISSSCARSTGPIYIPSVWRRRPHLSALSYIGIKWGMAPPYRSKFNILTNSNQFGEMSDEKSKKCHSHNIVHFCFFHRSFLRTGLNCSEQPDDLKQVECLVPLLPRCSAAPCELNLARARNTPQLEIARRLIGTRITLIGETINTTCGTIDSVHEDLSTAYTVTCPPSTEMSLKILLYDETSLDEDLTSARTIMHIADHWPDPFSFLSERERARTVVRALARQIRTRLITGKYNMIGKWELTGILLLHGLQLYSENTIQNRLLGTEITLLGTTTSTTCETINSVKPNGESIEDQSYSVFCPAATELTITVRLYDGVATANSDVIIMNIAEVIVYELIHNVLHAVQARHIRSALQSVYGYTRCAAGLVLDIGTHWSDQICKNSSKNCAVGPLEPP
eukprot:sb/3465238/